jgi:APA family basic amino acid/polyamine antiporter
VKTLVAGAAWMAVGIGAYAYYRRSQGLPLTQTVKVATLEPVGVEEVEYRSILVPLEPDEFSEEAIATAASLAARKRGAIHVLALVPVPTELPLDSPMAAQESAAQSQIERAKLICGARVTGRVERVRPGQATKRIVEVADAIDAAAIVMPLSYRDGKPVWGKTIQGVLAKRPTRVLVVGQPSGQQGHPVPV